MRLGLLILVVIGTCNVLQSQSVYIPNNSSSIHLLDRFEIKSGVLADVSAFNSSTRSYRRERISAYVDSFQVGSLRLSHQDFFNLNYLQSDNFDYGNQNVGLSTQSWSGFYKHKAAAFEKIDKEYSLVINPIAGLNVGYDSRLGQQAWLNHRGVEIRGRINHAIAFYTQFSDEILQPVSWVKDFYLKDTVIPGAGMIKTSSGSTFNYALASGYISAQVGKHFDVQFGHGSNFLGNGVRTFYLSDFSRNHLFLRLNSHFWKINYTNIWGMIYDYTRPTESILPRRHYYATTHLSVNVNKNLNVGCFQTISYQRDSGYASGGFEAEYLNPIIFYKPIENGLNSPDKAILGVDFKFNHSGHFSWYGQFVISEFVMKEVLAGKGWWGNKQAFQLGLKYVDVMDISNLDIQIENNTCRPYMYTSFTTKNAWVNYNQNMAHPLGANFNETIFIIRYQATDRLTIKNQSSYTVIGYDTSGSNWGQNIGLSYRKIERNYGNTIGQGVRTTLFSSDICVSWMFKHNAFIDLQLVYRSSSAAVSSFNSQTLYGGIGFRLNFGERRYDF